MIEFIVVAACIIITFVLVTSQKKAEAKEEKLRGEINRLKAAANNSNR